MSACPAMFTIKSVQKRKVTNNVREVPLDHSVDYRMARKLVRNCFEMVLHSRSPVDVWPSLRFLFLHTSNIDSICPPFASQRTVHQLVCHFGSTRKQHSKQTNRAHVPVPTYRAFSCSAEMDAPPALLAIVV